MPLLSSTFGWDAQSLQVMQCVRSVAGDDRLGKLVAKSASWVL
jgi:hypothetical protein